MILLTEAHTRTKVLINPYEIVSVTTAGVSSQWHGTHSYVKTTDGATHEVRETVEDIASALESVDQ